MLVYRTPWAIIVTETVTARLQGRRHHFSVQRPKRSSAAMSSWPSDRESSGTTHRQPRRRAVPCRAHQARQLCHSADPQITDDVHSLIDTRCWRHRCIWQCGDVTRRSEVVGLTWRTVDAFLRATSPTRWRATINWSSSHNCGHHSTLFQRLHHHHHHPLWSTATRNVSYCNVATFFRCTPQASSATCGLLFCYFAPTVSSNKAVAFVVTAASCLQSPQNAHLEALLYSCAWEVTLSFLTQ